MEELKREIKLIKNMIHFHSQLGNKGLKKKFEMRLLMLIIDLEKLIVELKEINK